MKTGNSESEVAHGERGAHPRQDEIGIVRRVVEIQYSGMDMAR